MRARALAVASLSLVVFALSPGCFAVRSSKGGGQAKAIARERLDPEDIAVLDAYRVSLVARDLTFPTGITFDEGGRGAAPRAGT